MNLDQTKAQPSLDERMTAIERGVEERFEAYGEWRASTEEWRTAVDGKLDAGVDEFERLNAKVDANTAITADIYEIVQMGRRFFRGLEKTAEVLGAISRFIFGVVKTLGVLAAAIGAVWAVIHNFLHGATPPR